MSALDVSIELITRRIFARLAVRFREWAALRRRDAERAEHAMLRLAFNMQASTYLDLETIAGLFAKEEPSSSDAERAVWKAFVGDAARDAPDRGHLEAMLLKFADYCKWRDERNPQVTIVLMSGPGPSAPVSAFSEAGELVGGLLRPPPRASLDELVRTMSIELRHSCCGDPVCIAPILRAKPVLSELVRSRHPAAVATNDELWAAYAREGLGEDEIYGLASMASSRGGASCRS